MKPETKGFFEEILAIMAEINAGDHRDIIDHIGEVGKNEEVIGRSDSFELAIYVWVELGARRFDKLVPREPPEHISDELREVLGESMRFDELVEEWNDLRWKNARQRLGYPEGKLGIRNGGVIVAVKKPHNIISEIVRALVDHGDLLGKRQSVPKHGDELHVIEVRRETKLSPEILELLHRQCDKCPDDKYAACKIPQKKVRG